MFNDLDVQYYNQAARQKGDRKDYTSAINTLIEAMRIYPDNPILEKNTAYYYEKWADTGEVVKIYLSAIKTLPNTEGVWENLKVSFLIMQQLLITAATLKPPSRVLGSFGSFSGRPGLH